MAQLRITWADLLRAGACAEALPAFQKAAAQYGNGVAIVLPDGWQEEHVRACMKMPGGALWLHFLERKEIVPVVASDSKRFPRALSGQRQALIARAAKRLEEARRANG